MGQKSKDKKYMADIQPTPYRSSSRLREQDGVFSVMDRMAKKRKMDSRIVKGTAMAVAGFVALSFTSSIYTATKVSGFKEQVANVESSAFKTRYDSLGQSVIEAYYSGSQSPINLLSGASWPGVNESKETGEESQSTGSTGPNGGAKVSVDSVALLDGYDSSMSLSEEDSKKDLSGVFSDPRKETLYYTVTMNGQSNRVSVQLLIPDINDTAKEPYLIGPPTIEQKYVTVQSSVDGSIPSVNPEVFTEAELNEYSIKTISDWASAMAANDGSQIKRIAGDNNSDNTYIGIGGFQLTGEPEIQWSYEFEHDFGSGKNNYIVARVKYLMTTDAKSDSKDNTASSITGGSGDKNSFTPTQTVDILLSDYAEGTPNIVAWGGAGSWDSLSPGMNAVKLTQEQIDASDAEQEKNKTDNSTDTSFGEESTSSSSSAPVVPTFSEDERNSKTSKSTSSTSKKSSKKTNTRSSSNRSSSNN